jgi:hypothetical protein
MPGQPGASGGTPNDARPPGKICVRCGADCAGRPRVKDAAGRYTCGACVERIKNGRAGSASASAKIAPAHAEIEPPPFIDEPASVSGGSCPNCAKGMPPDAVLCTGCGYSTQTGQALTTDAGPGPARDGGDSGVVRDGKACGKCGYDLSGVKGPRCPECGTINRAASRIDEIRADSKRIARMAYITPGVTALVASAAAVAILASTGAWHWTEPVALVLAWAFGVAVYFVCTLTFIGVDEPFPLMALRLLAVYSITWVVESAMGGILGGSARLAITYGVMAITLVVIMDIDWEDARIVVGVLIVAHFAAMMGLAFLLGA